MLGTNNFPVFRKIILFELFKRNKFWAVVGIGLVLAAILGLGEGIAGNGGAYKQYPGNGTINWANYSVSARGKAPLPRMEMKWEKAQKVATRRALIHSRYKLLQSIKNLRVEKGLFVRKYFQNHRELSGIIRGVIHNSQVIDRQLKNSDMVQVTTRIKLNSNLAKQLIPADVWYSDEISGVQDLELKTVKNASVRHKGVQNSYSGIIVDARSIPLQPALIIRLYDEKGRIVYGPGIVDRHIVHQRGMAIYVRNKTFVPASRVGENPLTVRAIRVRKDASCDLVLPQAKANALRKIYNSTNLLNKARLAIILTQESRQGLVEYDLSTNKE